MMSTPVYHRILVATDFSSCSDSALKQAVGLAQKSAGHITLVHVLPNLRRLVETASYKARADYLYGDGAQFRKEVEEASETRLKALAADLGSQGISVSYKTLIGSPYAEITRLVMEDGSDLVITGTRGISGWKQFMLGSTAQKLIRTCPVPVWVVKAEHFAPPKIVLAATDFSEGSHRAAEEALSVARQTAAKLHLVHVIDEAEFPIEILSNASTASSMWRDVREEVESRFQKLVSELGATSDEIICHTVNGAPWHEVSKLAAELQAELLVLGTVGRSGLQGVLIGNTVERVLQTCDCSILAVKPTGFVTPVLPPIVTQDQTP